MCEERSGAFFFFFFFFLEEGGRQAKSLHKFKYQTRAGKEKVREEERGESDGVVFLLSPPAGSNSST